MSATAKIGRDAPVARQSTHALRRWCPGRTVSSLAALLSAVLAAGALALPGEAAARPIAGASRAQMASGGLPPAFHARVNAVCRKTIAEVLAAVEHQFHGSAVQRAIAEVGIVEPIVQKFVASLRKLGTPATHEREWHTLLHDEQAAVGLVRGFREALEHRDVRRLRTVVGELEHLSKETGRLVPELGLENCGESSDTGDSGGAFGTASPTTVATGSEGSGSEGQAQSAATNLAPSYEGTAHNLTHEVTAPMELTNVKQGENGEITGEVVFQAPMSGSGSFSGTLADGELEFTVAAPTGGFTSETFAGEVGEGGRLTGTYTATLGEETQDGTWEVSPPSASITPHPQLGAAVVLVPVAGTVTYKLPGAHARKRLTTAIAVPVGTEVDAIAGTVEVTVASGASPAEESAELYEGEFVIEQETAAPYKTTFVLSQPLSGCASQEAEAAQSAVAASGSERRRHLWAHDTGGSFGTQGRYVSTTVEGTRWLTTDECASSTVTVSEGVVAVTDLLTHEAATVQAGGQFTAAKPHTSRAGTHSRRHHPTTHQPQGESGPLATLQGYWAAINAHEFGRAYGFLTHSGAGATEQEFTASEQHEHVRSASFRGKVIRRTLTRADIRVVTLVTHDGEFGCRTWSGNYQLTHSTGRWLIAHANLTVRPCAR